MCRFGFGPLHPLYCKCIKCQAPCHLSLVTLATYQAKLPSMDWSSRISIALGGSVLASIKFDMKEHDAVTCLRLRLESWECYTSRH